MEVPMEQQTWGDRTNGLVVCAWCSRYLGSLGEQRASRTGSAPIAKHGDLPVGESGIRCRGVTTRIKADLFSPGWEWVKDQDIRNHPSLFAR